MRARLLWFAALYAAGVGVTIGAAELLRLMLMP